MTADNLSKPVKIDSVHYARLAKISDESDPHVTLSSLVNSAIKLYLKTNHPELLTEIVSVPEQSAPASEPASFQKAAPRARKKK